MTRNRTAIDVISAISAQLMIVLMLVLATGIAIARYLSDAHDRLRRVELRIRKRSSRRVEL